MTTAADHTILALLWSSSDGDHEGLESFEPSQQLTDKVTADWESFRAQAEAMGFDPEQHLAIALHPDNEGDPWNAAAHDFILTSNGHGAGFWDSGRWHEPWGDRLTELCRKFGEIDCYVGDDSLIYCD
jgi:hypothetical protein